MCQKMRQKIRQKKQKERKESSKSNQKNPERKLASYFHHFHQANLCSQKLRSSCKRTASLKRFTISGQNSEIPASVPAKRATEQNTSPPPIPVRHIPLHTDLSKTPLSSAKQLQQIANSYLTHKLQCLPAFPGRLKQIAN